MMTRRQFAMLKQRIRKFLEEHPNPDDRRLMPVKCGGVDRWGGITEEYLIGFCDVMDDLYARHHNN